MVKKLLCIMLIFVTMFSITSCGAVKYDPGFYQVTKSNRSRYWKFDVDKDNTTGGRVTDSFSFTYTLKTRAGDRYENCYMIVEFKVNDVVEQHTIEIPEEGIHAKNTVKIEIPTTNERIKASYKILEVGGAVYNEQKKPLLSSESYVKDNNLKLTQFYFKSFGRRYWTYDFRVEYKQKNNTETIYLSDTIYTKSGTPVAVKSYSFISGYKKGWSIEKPMDRVERIILDCSIPLSEFINQNWANLKFYFPSLTEIYVKDVVFDKDIDGKLASKYFEGIYLYIGGDIDSCRKYMEGVSIVEADAYNIDMYEKDNLWN